jgi:hypothetical protein
MINHAIERVQSRFILNIAVHQILPLLQLLVIDKQQLLIRRDAFLLLDLSLDIGEGVRALPLKQDGIAGGALNEDIHDENTSNQIVPPNKPEQKTSKERGKNKLELVARAGFRFSQFCEVGGLTIINKRRKPNFTEKKFESCLVLATSRNVFFKY